MRRLSAEFFDPSNPPDPFFDEEPQAWHDVAQICLNGHAINPSTKASPEFCKKFCDKCGASTVTQCQHCKADIQGRYHALGVVDLSLFPVPSFCSGCGLAYAWTESRLQAARDLAEELEGLTSAEKETLSKSLDDLVRDTPQTQVAATRLKKLLSKVTKEGGTALREILVSVLSETAKRTLGIP